ncbi:MAG: metal-dependent transcriptional regulator [Deinococcales bacterium]
MEDYLKAIHELGEEGVKTQKLADSLGINPASVTGMLKKLAELKLVSYVPYQGVSLTEAGKRVALEVLRHHRLLETYLAEVLGYAWHEVHEEAERLEHHISEDFEARIAAFLGEPTYDPHGDPIPRSDLSMPQNLGQPLSSFNIGDELCITRITDQKSDFLAFLAEYELKPQSIVNLKAVHPLSKDIELTLKDDTIKLSPAMAKHSRCPTA